MVTGGFGVGKTTLIGAMSEIVPLRTEAPITQASAGTDSLDGIEHKTTTTVALDFGRITFSDPPMKIFFFGTPGQDRFEPGWKAIARGAVGTIVVVDTARLEESFTSLTFAEALGCPFVVAVNQFEGNPHRYPASEISDALALDARVPVIACDAREAASIATVVAALITHVKAQPHPLPHARGALL
ncbi:GTP-binding protein [Streptomyces sp. NPDC001889]